MISRKAGLRVCLIALLVLVQVLSLAGSASAAPPGASTTAPTITSAVAVDADSGNAKVSSMKVTVIFYYNEPVLLTAQDAVRAFTARDPRGQYFFGNNPSQPTPTSIKVRLIAFQGYCPADGLLAVTYSGGSQYVESADGTNTPALSPQTVTVTVICPMTNQRH